LSRLLFIVFVIYAASKLGPELFGILSFSLATVELLSAIGDLGLTRYGARELVRNWDKREVLAGEILFFQVLTSLVFSLGGLIAVLAWQPSYPKLQLLLLGMLAIFFSGLVNTTETIFVASQNFFLSALLTFTGRLIYVGIGFVALAAGASVVIVMVGFLTAMVAEILLRLGMVVGRITHISFNFSARRLWRMLIATFPFAIAAAANIAFLRINVMILELLAGDVAVGVFNVAFTLFTPFVWIPFILSRTMFPGLTDLCQRDPARARLNTWQWWRLMALAGIPAALAVTLLAQPALSYFPAGYEGSAGVLAILIWALPPMLLISLGFNVLQTINRENSAALAQTLGALVVTVSCFILIPFYGIKGAAAATVIAAAFMGTYIYFEVYRHFIGKHMITLFTRPVLAGIVMAGVALSLRSFNAWAATALGLVSYTAVILMTGGIRPSELKSLMLHRS